MSTITIYDAAGVERRFTAPGSVPYHVLHDLVQAFSFLEGCACGWSGADDTEVIYQLLAHLLEKYSVKEVEA